MNLDFDKAPTADQLEEKAASGGHIPKGPYRAMLAEATDDKVFNDKTFDKLVMEIMGGQYDGRKVFVDLYHADEGSDSKDAFEFKRDVYTRWGLKLGLYEAGEGGRIRPVDGVSKWEDIVGAREVVIEVVIETRDGKDRNKVTPYGIHLPDETSKGKKKSWGEMANDHANGTGETTAKREAHSSREHVGAGANGTAAKSAPASKSIDDQIDPCDDV